MYCADDILGKLEGHIQLLNFFLLFEQKISLIVQNVYHHPHPPKPCQMKLETQIGKQKTKKKEKGED